MAAVHWFGDDEDGDDNDGRPTSTLPATLPTTRIFPHYPNRTLPEVKKTYPSQPDA